MGDHDSNHGEVELERVPGAENQDVVGDNEHEAEAAAAINNVNVNNNVVVNNNDEVISNQGSSLSGMAAVETLEASYTETEVLKKISDLKDKLKIRASSVRKPSQFDEQTMNIREFVESFDNYREVIGLQKTDAYAAFLSYLEEKHISKLRNLNKSPGEKEDWDTIKLEVISTLTPPTQKMEARVKLNTARQGAKETLAEFAERLKKWVDQCYDKPAEVAVRERIMKDHLVKGCNDDNVAIDMMSKIETSTVPELIKIGMAKELAMKERRLEAAISTKQIEDSIAVLTVSESPNLKQMAYKPRPGNGRPPNGNARQQRRQDDKRNVVCYNCNKLGHFARDCRSKMQNQRKNNRDCWQCGKPGHMARDCRSKPGNNFAGKKRNNFFADNNPKKYFKTEWPQANTGGQSFNRQADRPTNDQQQQITRTVTFDDQSNNKAAGSVPQRTPVNLMTNRTPGILPVTGITRTIANDRAKAVAAERQPGNAPNEDYGLSLIDEMEFDLN